MKDRIRKKRENLFLVPVTNNVIDFQFEVSADGIISKTPYSIDGDILTLFHTVIRGSQKRMERRLVSKLAISILGYIATGNFKVILFCPLIKKYLEEHPQWKRCIEHIHYVESAEAI